MLLLLLLLLLQGFNVISVAEGTLKDDGMLLKWLMVQKIKFKVSRAEHAGVTAALASDVVTLFDFHLFSHCVALPAHSCWLLPWCMQVNCSYVAMTDAFSNEVCLCHVPASCLEI